MFGIPFKRGGLKLVKSVVDKREEDLFFTSRCSIILRRVLKLCTEDIKGLESWGAGDNG